MKTFDEYVIDIQKEVDDTSDGAKTVIKRYLTSIYAEVMRQVGQYLMSSVTEDDTAVLNQTAYPVSQDASVIHQVAYKPVGATNFRLLQNISLEDYKDNFINRPASLPTVWFLDGNVVNVAPKPSEAGTVRRVYTPNITDLVSGETSLLPDRYANVLIDGVVAKFKAWENNLDAASIYRSLYGQELHDCVLDIANRTKPLRPKLYNV